MVLLPLRTNLLPVLTTQLGHDVVGRQVDVLVSQGASMADAIRQIGVSEVVCATNCSITRSSTPCEKPRSS